MSKVQWFSVMGIFFWCVGSDEIVWLEEVYCILEIDLLVMLMFVLIDMCIYLEDFLVYDEMICWQCSFLGDFEYEYWLFFVDGWVKWVYLVVYVIWSEDGGVEYIVGLQDIIQC